MKIKSEYLLQISGSLVAQIVKNLLAMQETRVRFLGQENPWRREWQAMPVFLLRTDKRSLVDYSPLRSQRTGMTERLTTFNFYKNPT